MLYSEGVLDGTFVHDDGTTTECGTRLNHAVTLVGYKPGGLPVTTISFEYNQVCQTWGTWTFCTTERVEHRTTEPGGEPYWKIQNSWSDRWGSDGFYYAEV